MSMTPDTGKRIGFVATRIAGTDGVSLEIAKWARILERMGHTCFYIAGQSDRPAERSSVIPEAHFKHALVDAINLQAFREVRRTPELTSQIHELRWVIKQKLQSAIARFELDVVIAENSLAIPMNIPLGLAIVEAFMEGEFGCIAHHHDFAWERERFLVNSVDDFLHTAFPPHLPQMQHVVISTMAAREFARRTSLSCRVIPNIMDFDEPAATGDEFDRDFRPSLGLRDDDIIILQPTRIVARKGIEHSIELVRHLNDPRCKLLLTHAAGDEGGEYLQRVQKYAALMDVDVVFAADRFDEKRGESPDGSKQYSFEDAYRHADLVTYPSTYEGFGNAFLEAIYFKKPVLCNRYAIYRTDIEPCGFQVLLMDGYLTDALVEQVRRVLDDAELRKQMTEHNYAVAARYFSFQRAENELRAILAKPTLCTTRQVVE